MPPTRRQKSKEKTPLLQVIEGAQNPVQNQIGEDGHIEHSDRIGVVVASLTGLEGPTIHNLPSDEVPVGGYKYVRG